MARSELHKRKFKKNIAVLVVIVVLMLIVYGITVVRIQAGLAAQ